MREQWDEETRAAMIEYRLERAHSTLDEADLLYKNGYYNTAINRLYYACFYATIALLLSRRIEASTHNGVKTMLSMHFVRGGLLGLSHGETYSLLFDMRHTNDYRDFVYCDAPTVEELRPRAKAFIDAVEELTKEVPSE